MGQPYYDAVGTSRGRLPVVPLAGAKPERYIFLSRIAAVHVGQVIVGVLRPYRNLSRIGVRDRFRTNRSRRPPPAYRDMKNWGAGWWKSSRVIAGTRASPGFRRPPE